MQLMDKQISTGREGYIGWMGMGGSIMQWNPELDVGIAYVTFDLLPMDSNNTRAKSLQIALKQCIDGTIPVEVVQTGCTCQIF